MNLTAQNIGLGMIVATVCLAFLAALILPALGYHLDPAAVTAATTLFVGLAGGIGGWLFGSRTGAAQGELSVLKAQQEK